MTKQMIDPEELTPASRRALQKILIGFTVFVVFLVGAVVVVVRQSNSRSTCQARQSSWGYARAISLTVTAPLPLDGYTGELLRARRESNVTRATNRKLLLDTLGRRPC